MSLRTADRIPTRPAPLQWERLAESQAGIRLQFVAGLLAGLVFLAAVGQEIGPLRSLAAFGALGMAVIWPAAGLTTLALIMPSRQSDILQPLYFHATLVGAIAVGCIFRVASRDRPIHIHPAIALLIGYTLYTALSIVPAISGHPGDWTPTAALSFVRLMSGVGLFLVASFLFRQIPALPVVMVALLGACVATIVGLIAYLEVPGLVSLVDGLLNPERGARAVGGFGSANYFGFAATQAMLLAAGLWFTFPRHRGILTVMLAILVAGVVLSFSRSSYIASVIGLTVILTTRDRRAAVAFAIVAVLGAAFAYPIFLEARVGSDVLDPDVIAERALSDSWRARASEAGLLMFTREPLLGVGFGVFQHLSPAFIGASPATFSHNAYIAFLAEQGIVGSLMVAGMAVALGLALWRSQGPYRGAALAMGAAYLVQSNFINSATSFQISALTWLVFAAALQALPDRASQPAEDEV